MSDQKQIENAINVGNPDLIFHTNSTYPSMVDELNLQYIKTLMEMYPEKHIGYSGHEFGLVPTFTAVAFGASYIERHITLDRTMWGSDQFCSIEPVGLIKLVKGIRAIEQSIGHGGPRKIIGGEISKLKSLRGWLKICSIILARGGSKEIPRKNIIDLNGKPLIWYSIQASKRSIVDETWLSTDDFEIKSIAQKYGANVIDRPKSISGDQSKSEDALIHFAENVDFDVLVFIQPTSPLINSSDINGGLAMLKDFDSIFSGYDQHWIPTWDENISPISWNISDRPMRQIWENIC